MFDNSKILEVNLNSSLIYIKRGLNINEKSQSNKIKFLYLWGEGITDYSLEKLWYNTTANLLKNLEVQTFLISNNARSIIFEVEMVFVDIEKPYFSEYSSYKPEFIKTGSVLPTLRFNLDFSKTKYNEYSFLKMNTYIKLI